jgi:hypothetical protein
MERLHIVRVKRKDIKVKVKALAQLSLSPTPGNNLIKGSIKDETRAIASPLSRSKIMPRKGLRKNLSPPRTSLRFPLFNKGKKNNKVSLKEKQTAQLHHLLPLPLVGIVMLWSVPSVRNFLYGQCCGKFFIFLTF